MSLRSERDDYPEIYGPTKKVLVDPSNKDKHNLQPDRFGDMTPEEFDEHAKRVQAMHPTGITPR
jgi:hypothetical protein